MKKYITFQKDWQKDAGILLGFLAIFLLFEWRLFAVGSESQLFLYGDNLATFNNLFYLFQHFSWRDIFGTFIGQNGMLGSYPMSEPQNSLFYLPITALLLLFQLIPLTSEALYYGLLLLHVFHFILGTFFIYKLARRFFVPNRSLAFLAGLVYLGLGWNVAWFGTATLSFMIGVLPLVFYAFFGYLRSGKKKTYIWFVLSLCLLLYAGGIVNFFFYVLLNLSLLYILFVTLPFREYFDWKSKREVVVKFSLLFIGAPFLALLGYAVQLYNTYIVSGDIFHSSSAYTYLAYFGTHFYDLIGLVIPKFALLNFGMVTNPTIIWEFSLANIIYVGLIPLLVFVLGVSCLREKRLFLLAFFVILNFLFSFGGAFFLYDATYFFPGNNLFRGHYKYLMLSGIYLSLLVPFILAHWQKEAVNEETFKKIQKGILWFLALMLVLGILSGVGAFVLKYLQKDLPLLLTYYTLTLTFTNYFFRILLIGVLSFSALFLFLRYQKRSALFFLAFILLIDTSVNFKYTALSTTSIEQLTSQEFFKCCLGKTIINDIDKYSQLYFIPEILGVDPLFQYSAIPNGSVVDYQGHISDVASVFSYPRLAAAGIEGVLTTRTMTDPRFVLESSKLITNNNYEELYLYNADGDIHNDWGKRQSMIGQLISYYSVPDVQDAFFTTSYKEKSSDDGFWDYMEQGEEFNQYVPVIINKKRGDRDRSVEALHNDVEFLQNTATQKKIAVKNNEKEGLLFVNVPYASIWKARVNGKEAPLYKANGAFIGIKIEEPQAEVELFVAKKGSFIALTISLVSLLGLIIFFFLSERQTQVGRNFIKSFFEIGR